MVAYTTTYSLAKPTVGEDEDVWGGYLNGNFDTIESLLKGTTSLTSLSLAGNITFGDNDKAVFGAGSDLQVFHDGSNSYISENSTGNLLIQGTHIYLKKGDGSENYIDCVANQGVTLRYDNAAKLATTTSGIDVSGTVEADGAQIDLSSTRQVNTQMATSGSGYGAITCVEPTASNLRGLELEGQLLRFGTNAYNQTTSIRRLQINDAGEAIFYEDTGADVKMRWLPATEELRFEDNVKATFGTSSDLQIYHDGNNSYVSDQGQGVLYIQGSNNVQIESATGENMAVFLADNAVELYYDNSKKLNTTSGGIDVTGNIAVSGTVDGRDVATDGTKLDGIESGATADQTASEILTAIKTVDGSGSGLDADTVDGIQASSFLRSDANDSISNPFNLDFSTSNTSNYIPADNTTALAVAPFSALAWHDVFAFNRYYSASQEEWNGSAWSSTTLDDELFAQKENQSITVASGSTITKVRWNFTGTSWIQPQWLAIGFTYVAGGASKTVTVESSSDGGSTWTTRHSSTTTANGRVVHFKLSDWSGDNDVRVTIDRNDTNALKMSYMSLLTARSGDQGKGKEAQLPFGWDADKNLSMEGNLLFGDNEKATFGTSSDLQIYHDGSNSYIQDAGTGSLVLSSNGFGVKMITDAGDTLFKADKDGANNLYYDNALKLATTSTGVSVTGVFTAESLQEDYDALSGTTPSIDADNGGAFSLTMTGNTTFTFASVTSGRSVGFVLELTGNGGTVTWPSSVDWAGGTAPDAPASGEKDILVFWTRDGGTTWHGVLSIDAAA